MAKEHILVTGAAGYIGSILVPELLTKGYRVTAVDNFLYGQASLLDVCFNPNLEIIRGDVRSPALMKEIVKKADVIMPLACLTGAPLCAKDPFAAEEVNLGAIKHLLELRSKT